MINLEMQFFNRRQLKSYSVQTILRDAERCYSVKNMPKGSMIMHDLVTQKSVTRIKRGYHESLNLMAVTMVTQHLVPFIRGYNPNNPSPGCTHPRMTTHNIGTRWFLPVISPRLDHKIPNEPQVES